MTELQNAHTGEGGRSPRASRALSEKWVDQDYTECCEVGEVGEVGEVYTCLCFLLGLFFFAFVDDFLEPGFGRFTVVVEIKTVYALAAAAQKELQREGRVVALYSHVNAWMYAAMLLCLRVSLHPFVNPERVSVPRSGRAHAERVGQMLTTRAVFHKQY